jgi:hypothetical protein
MSSVCIAISLANCHADLAFLSTITPFLSWTLTAMLTPFIKPLPAAESDDQMSLLEAQPLASKQTSHGQSDGSVEPSLYHELSSIPQARLLAFCGPIQSCLLILDEGLVPLLWICINEAFVRGLSTVAAHLVTGSPRFNRISLLTGVPESCSDHLPGNDVFFSVAQDDRRHSLGMRLAKLGSPVAGSVTHPHTDLERWKQPLPKKHCL